MDGLSVSSGKNSFDSTTPSYHSAYERKKTINAKVVLLSSKTMNSLFSRPFSNFYIQCVIQWPAVSQTMARPCLPSTCKTMDRACYPLSCKTMARHRPPLSCKTMVRHRPPLSCETMARSCHPLSCETMTRPRPPLSAQTMGRNRESSSGETMNLNRESSSVQTMRGLCNSLSSKHPPDRFRPRFLPPFQTGAATVSLLFSGNLYFLLKSRATSAAHIEPNI
jgi:hypothetical protein